MNCKICNEETVFGEEYCKDHFIKIKTEEFLDNSDPENLGIVKWIEFFFPHYARNKVARFHKAMHLRWLHLYNPFYVNKMERLVNDICWRGGGKSTVYTFFDVLYALCNNGSKIKIKPQLEVIEVDLVEKFICIASETGDMAEEFVSRIRNELMTNERLKWFYPGKLKKAFDAYDKKWTQRAFKYNGCYILGIGQGHQARGRIKGAHRITWLIGDDIYSEDSIKTKIGRNNVKKWWNKAIKNTVDDLLGKIILVGTIVHEDTVTVSAMRNKRWKTSITPLMPIILFRHLVKEHLKVNYDTHDCKLPFDEIENEFERVDKQRKYFWDLQESRDWQLSWPDRANLYMIVTKFQEAVLDRDVQAYYQEMFHKVVPDEQKKFNPKMFQPLGPWRIWKEGGYVWMHAPDRFGDKPVNINVQIGVDLSGAETAASDDVALVAACAFPDETYAMLRATYGKFNQRDELYNNVDAEIDINRENVERIGFMDELYRMSLELFPQYVRIGKGGGVESSVIREVDRLFRKMHSQTLITKRDQKKFAGDKISRIVNSLAHRYQAYQMYHSAGLDAMEEQLEYLGGMEHDDLADAGEVALYGLMTPSAVDYDIVMGIHQTSELELSVHEKTRIFTQQIKKELGIDMQSSWDWRSNN